MKFFFFFSCCLLLTTARGQQLLKGVVTDENDRPVPSASIFLSNTSFGTKSDDAGQFQLSVPAGKYDLIVSSVGYNTYSRTIQSDQTAALNIRLSLKAEQMETVVIEPFEKDGWKTWGKFFMESFVGQSAFANECRISNPEVIRFRNSKKEHLLTAMAMAPLLIENKALGYFIQYQLESFSFDFESHYLVYTGYPLFVPMEGSKGQQKKWTRNRKEAYEGSMLHFMRTIYRNTLQQEGFEIRALQKIPNLEKQRVRAAYKSNRATTTTSSGQVMSFEINKDTAEYYRKILAQADFQDIIGRTVLPGDSIAYAVNATTAGMNFDNYLLVIYKKKLAPLEYQQLFPKSSTAMMSQITLLNGRPVEIQANGNYYNVVDLISLGYWAWSEKIAMMLPFDYKP